MSPKTITTTTTKSNVGKAVSTRKLARAKRILINYPMYIARVVEESDGLAVERQDVDVSSKATALIGIILAEALARMQQNVHGLLDGADRETMLLSHARTSASRVFSNRQLRNEMLAYTDEAVGLYNASLVE